MTEGWLDLRGAASYASCSPRTLTRELKAGRLIGYRLCRRREWRLKPSDIDTWMEASRTPALYTPEPPKATTARTRQERAAS